MLDKLFKEKRLSYKFLLISLSVISFLFIVLVFYPGFMSYDSLNQYGQALGYLQLNDWHPPIMALLWRAGIEFTGLVSSFMILTVGVFVLSSTLLSLFILKITNSRLLSLLPFLLLLMPNTITFLGVVWKDVFLASTFMLGATFLLLGSSTHPLWNVSTRKRNALILLGVATLIFGSSFRHGVWPAFIPLLVYASYKFHTKNKNRLLFAAISILAIMSFSTIISRVFNVSPGGASVVVMIDDIINTYSEQDIQNSNLTENSKKYLIDVKRQCDRLGVRTYAAFLCDDSHVAFSKSVSLEPTKLKSFWQQSIIDSPLVYLSHRADAFISFLSPSYIYAWQERIEPNPYGLVAANTAFTRLTEKYVKFFIRDWPALFKPYTWLIIITALFVTVLNKKKELRHSTIMIAIFLSAALFLLSFFPAAIVSDYRMTYTFTFACGLMGIILIIDIFENKHLNRSKMVSLKSKKTR